MDATPNSPQRVTDAFGKGSPSRNLPFPDGNLTAAEIIAYCPHWLKSIDVIDRFVNNGGKYVAMAALINEFRRQPGGDKAFKPNSVCILAQNAMRGAGFDKWTLTSHLLSQYCGEGEWSEWDLSVSDFRTPRETHPAISEAHERNRLPDPIQFRDLALHVKKHPAGSDALDLARCVSYALEHPQESWLFPNDFVRLIHNLGGPQQVQSDHLDRQVFERRVPSDTATTPNHRFPHTRASAGSHKVIPATSDIMARTRASAKREHDAGSPLKRSISNVDIVDTVAIPNLRRSNRISAKPAVNRYKESSGSEGADQDNHGTADSHSVKKSKVQKNASADDEFDKFESMSASEESAAELNCDDEELTMLSARIRKTLEEMARSYPWENEHEDPLDLDEIFAEKSEDAIDPELTRMAHLFDDRVPQYLQPPVLDRNRLVVDDMSVHLYAEIGATDLYASALSSTRFNGPRRHPPFRELYRLTDPPTLDTSDWAENIRWAKEQERVFGSRTWTEYDYHLEQIKQHRRDTMWVSEEAVLFTVIDEDEDGGEDGDGGEEETEQDTLLWPGWVDEIPRCGNGYRCEEEAPQVSTPWHELSNIFY